MIFHKPDRTLKTLSGCWKRAQRFAHPGAVDVRHPLAAAWRNCQLSISDDLVENINSLDWFASLVERHSKNHLLDGDLSLSAMLHEWKQAMPFDPTILSKAA